MADLLIIENFPASNIAEQSYLTADAAAGQAIINVENADTLAVDDYVLVGVKGSETGQILKILSITGLQVTFLTNLTSPHYRNEPIYKLRGNQAKIYRAANVDGSVPSDGSFSILSTITYQGDQVTTSYNDSTGGSGYWYKYTLYNSTSLVESPLADAVPIRGGNYGYYVTADDVREEAGFSSNPYITDQIVYDKLIKAQSEVNASLVIGGYTLPLTSIPEMVANATLLLAAGYLLTKEYGPEHTGTNKEGTLKIQQARDLLKKIENGSAGLVDPITQTPVAQSGNIDGYPDSLAEGLTPSEGRIFSVTDVY